MAVKKQFSELTEAGKKRRLEKYAKEREQRGTFAVLGRLASAPSFMSLKNGDTSARVVFYVYDKETQKSTRMEANAYIKKESVKFKQYMESLRKGQGVNLELKERQSEDGSRTFLNIYNIFSVNKKDQSDVQAQQEVVDNDVEAVENNQEHVYEMNAEDLAGMLPF